MRHVELIPSKKLTPGHGHGGWEGEHPSPAGMEHVCRGTAIATAGPNLSGQQGRQEVRAEARDVVMGEA